MRLPRVWKEGAARENGDQLGRNLGSGGLTREVDEAVQCELIRGAMRSSFKAKLRSQRRSAVHDQEKPRIV